jgi:hypothetical protein
MIEMSSAWRDDSRGTDCSNPFSATGESYKPDHSDRSGAERRAAREAGKCRWTGKRTITRRAILHRVPQRLKLTEQQSWQDIAQSKGMTYLQRLPEAIPEGQFLVHNSVRPTHPLGSHGFRAWLQAQDEHLEPCDCGWTPELGTHYRVKLKILVRDRAARSTDFA